MSDYIAIGPCPYCGTWAAQSYLDKLAKTKAVVTASPEHDTKGSESVSGKCPYWRKDHEGTLLDGTGHIESWSCHKGCDAISPAPSPWHDASETPDPRWLCCAKMENGEYWIVYFDSIQQRWRTQQGNMTITSVRQWQRLDTSNAATKGKEEGMG